MLACLVFPPKLHLEKDGLRLTGLRSWRIAWVDVAPILVQRMRRTSMVVMEYRDARIAWARRAAVPRPGSMLTSLGMRPEALQ